MSTSTIEVYKFINPLYYTIPLYNSDKSFKEKYGIFNDLTEERIVGLKERVLQLYGTQSERQYDIFTEQEPDSLLQTLENGNTTLNEEKIIQSFIDNSNDIKDQLNDANTVVIYLTDFEGSKQLMFEAGSYMYDLYENLKKTTSDNNFKPFPIRVYSSNKDYDIEFMKRIIRKDIDDLFEFIKTNMSNTSTSAIKKLCFITDKNGVFDYHVFNVERISTKTKRKELIQLVVFANEYFITKAKENYKVFNRQGVQIGTIDFMIIPSVRLPMFLDGSKSVSEFSKYFKRVKPSEQNISDKESLYNRINKFGEKIKELKFKLKRRYDEFIKYVEYVHQKLLDLKEIEGKKKDTIDEFYKLEMILGANGENLVNITKGIHDPNFRFQARNLCEISMNALDVELYGKITRLNANNTIEITIYTYCDLKMYNVAVFTVNIKYGSERNEIFIKKVVLDNDITDATEKQKYSDFFKINKEGKSSLVGRQGIIRRKIRNPKYNLEVLSGNLRNSSVSSSLYFIPTIEIKEADILKYFKIEIDDELQRKLKMSEVILETLLSKESAHAFYLYISSTNPSQIYDDTSKYSKPFIVEKMKEHTKFIMNILFVYSKVFRPIENRMGSNNQAREFKGKHQILKYELMDKNILIIDENNKPPLIEIGEEKSGIIVKRGNEFLLQDKTNVTMFYKLSQTYSPEKKKTITLCRKSKMGTYAVDSYEYGNNKIVRASIKLYITQNMPSYEDFEKEIRRKELQKAFNELTKTLSKTFSPFEKTRKIGKYINT